MRSIYLIAATVFVWLVIDLDTANAWQNSRLVPARVTGHTGRQDDEITINPAEDKFVGLEELCIFAKQELGFNLRYNATVFGNNKSEIKFSETITVSKQEFFELVQTILRASSLAIVDSETSGMKQVIRLAEIRPFAREGNAQDFPNGEYLTQIFELKSISTAKAKELLQKFFNADGDNATQQLGPISELPNRGLLIVSETAANLKRIQDLLQRYDLPDSQIGMEFIKANDGFEAEELAKKLKEILNIRADAGNNAPQQQTYAVDVTVSAEPKTNRVILIGPRKGIAEAMLILDKLNEEIELKTQSYRFKYITAERVDDLIRRSLGITDEGKLKSVYNAVIDAQTNQLVVTARDNILARIDSIKQQLDKEPTSGPGNSPIQYYKIKNVKAAEILRTLQSIERNIRARPPNGGAGQRIDGLNYSNGITNVRPNSTSSIGDTTTLDSQLDTPLNPQIDFFDRGNQNNLLDPLRNSAISSPGSLIDQLAFNYSQNQIPSGPLIPGEARVVVDENTNTLIVAAEPAVQRLYAEMIEKLDQRRPQVLIEVTVVTLDCNETIDLGVEVSGGDRTGTDRLFAFTQFGLSTVDAATGALSIIPGLGFNGTLIDPDSADAVLRALSTHARSRVVSAPRILVNDNATGLLSSVAEVPFSSINASTTVATTSFAGFAEAGTTISMTPQISEGEQLNLEFDVVISDFTESTDADLPPPRRSDQVTSQVTIPDGHTVIVGGLSRNRGARSQAGLPFIENIPVLNLLSGRVGKENSKQNIYIFIKPIILRDDKFRQLRFLSEFERLNAGIPDDLPQSCPVIFK